MNWFISLPIKYFSLIFYYKNDEFSLWTNISDQIFFSFKVIKSKQDQKGNIFIFVFVETSCYVYLATKRTYFMFQWPFLRLSEKVITVFWHIEILWHYATKLIEILPVWNQKYLLRFVWQTRHEIISTILPQGEIDIIRRI